MNIGDKVRSLSGREEGFITAFLGGNEVEVEIEDGFRIPYLKSDLVVVSKGEEDAFGDIEQTEKTPKKSKKEPTRSLARSGIFLAFTHVNDQQLELHFINNTDYTIPFTFSTEKEGRFEGVAAGGLSPKSHKKLHEVSLQNFELWPAFVFQLLFHAFGPRKKKEPLARKMLFKASTFFKHKADVPLLQKEGYLFQIDNEAASDISVELLKESFYSPKNTFEQKDMHQETNVRNHSLEVDLHIEELVGDPSSIHPDQMLGIQLESFDRTLDEAVIRGYSEVIFIHGVGAGTLRSELHRRLGKHPHVSYFEDAQKEKFGYGATRVHIK